ncbi:MAG TPA: M20 family metallopeptidase [Candidatus Bathyarchaeia archaeon]|nr:M20 family metallopeptidase [Candidatus Bathyarchaeia archaeon]
MRPFFSRGDFLQSTELLYDLVNIPSTSTHEQDISLFVEERLSDLGMEIIRSGNNLIGKMGREGPVLALCGHLDTVPPFFPPRIQGRKLHGRGAADDKGGLAAVISAVANTDQERLMGTLLTAFVVDEELKSRGAQQVLPQLHADFGIICEPTNLKIVNGQKGRLTFRIQSVGKRAHASKPELGKNAIIEMAKLVLRLEELPLIRHPKLGHETITVSTIAAGDAVNIVPDLCSIDVDYRYVPPNNASRVLATLRAKLPEARIEFADDPRNFTRPFYLPAHQIITLLSESIRRTGIEPQIVTMDAGTDASRFNEAEIPTVVFGPGGIAQAHTSDEWIELREVEMASLVFEELIRSILIT